MSSKDHWVFGFSSRRPLLLACPSRKFALVDNRRLDCNISESNVGKYLVRHNGSPSKLRTFLENHLKEMVSADFFTLPTIRFQIVYVLLVLAHDRRRIVQFAVAQHPTAEWVGQQLRE